MFLVPDAPDEAAAVAALMQEFPMRLIAVTEGAEGSRGYTRDGAFADAPGFQVDYLDATGAGDAYAAGLLAFLLRLGTDANSALNDFGPHLLDALRYANACGALATTYLGATPHGLSPQTVQALLETTA